MERDIVSTVSFRQAIPILEFVEIDEVGNGEAFLTSDEQQIVTQLMVLPFGSNRREKVVEAFNLLSK
jgi:hypothetical protein